MDSERSSVQNVITIMGEKLKTSKDKRKTFVAREDLMNRLREMAKLRGYTLYGMINEVFELAVKAEDAGVSLRSAVEGREVLKKARETGFILGLESLWYEMAELAYQKAKTQALKSWFEAGVWLAKRYATSEIEDPIKAFAEDLEAFTWNAPEFSLERTGREVSVRIISPKFPESYTLLFEAFLEGALKAFGYEIMDKEVAMGTIRLKAVRKEANEEK